MTSKTRREVYKREGYEIQVIGVRPAPLRDVYHALLRLPWWATLLFIVTSYLVLNALFAAVYVETGGISSAEPGSFVDAYFFSVQTMGTIGYGTMAPVTRLANAVVVVESVTGLVATALAAGLAFVRFSQVRPRMIFSSRVAIAPLDGVPTLMIRLGNDRRSRIVDARFRLTVVRARRTAEGVAMYRTVDLPLVRDHAQALARSWTVMHVIDPGSPLHDETPGSLARGEAELSLSVRGIDETLHQEVYADHTWMSHQVVFGARLADVLSDTPDGNLLLDMSRFHDLELTDAVEGFPYGRGALPDTADLAGQGSAGASAGPGHSA